MAFIFISLLSWIKINSSIENRNPKISDRFSFLQKWIVKQLIPPKFAHTKCPTLDPKNQPHKKMNEVSTSENIFEQVWSKNKTICVLLPTSWLSVLLLLYRILYVCVTVLCGMSGVSKTPSTYLSLMYSFDPPP